MIDYNRLSVIDNPYQGQYERILTVCSGGVLRSPTAAWVLSNEPFNANTRSCGTEDYAVIRMDEALLRWAHNIVCMTKEHEEKVQAMLAEYKIKRPVLCLNIPDNFRYRDSNLIKMITAAYTAAYEEEDKEHNNDC